MSITGNYKHKAIVCPIDLLPATSARSPLAQAKTHKGKQQPCITKFCHRAVTGTPLQNVVSYSLMYGVAQFFIGVGP